MKKGALSFTSFTATITSDVTWMDRVLIINILKQYALVPFFCISGNHAN